MFFSTGDNINMLTKGLQVLGAYGISKKAFKEAFDIFDYNYFNRSRLFIYYNSINYRYKLSLLMMSAFFRGHQVTPGFFKKKFFSFSTLKLDFFIKYKNKYIMFQRYRLVNSFLKRYFNYR